MVTTTLVFLLGCALLLAAVHYTRKARRAEELRDQARIRDLVQRGMDNRPAQRLVLERRPGVFITGMLGNHEVTIEINEFNVVVDDLAAPMRALVEDRWHELVPGDRFDLKIATKLEHESLPDGTTCIRLRDLRIIPNLRALSVADYDRLQKDPAA